MTLKEIYQALIDGKKLCCPDIGFRYVHLKDGNLKYHDGSFACISFTLGTWSIYEEPEDLNDKTWDLMGEIAEHAKGGFYNLLAENIRDLIRNEIKQAKL